MKDFSIFRRARQFAKSLNSLKLPYIGTISRKEFVDHETITFRSTAPGIEYALLLIENALLLNTNREGRVYAGFQKLSAMKPIADRYMRIADISESLIIFGEPDWKPPRHPNIRVIPLDPEFELTKEWFLVADSPTLKVALVAQADDGSIDEANNRRFSVIKTSNPLAVTELARRVEGVVDWMIVT
ncbi:MAG TPA: DICT sensory domain-containing protein [Pyrinomonadaceae bacterium]|nr:DICT sensory domain-containing protein [Pyrinomonadaceae bacterium]